MRVYQTPGVYHERADAIAGGVAPLRTDVTALVGLAPRGPLHLAVPVESYRQYMAWFGDAFAAGYLAYCARGFFENGGRRLWVVRVASPAASVSKLTMNDALGDAWRICASSPGVWGDGVAVRVAEVRRTRIRGRLDLLDPRRLEVPSVAGFAPFTHIEIVRGASRARAVVVEVDAAASVLRLARAPTPAPPPGPREVRIETLAYTVEVYADRQLRGVFADLSLIPEHPRYGPALLKQPWQAVDPRDPTAAVQRVPEADLAAEFFRIARDRKAVPPPPIVIVELRSSAHREALLPLTGVAGAAPSNPVPLAGGADGLAALSVGDFIGAPVPPSASPIELAQARRGIAALDVVDDVALVAVPDIHIRPEPQQRLLPRACEPDPCLPAPVLPPPMQPAPVGDLPPVFDLAAIYQVQSALVLHCEHRRDRFAILDAPFETCSRLTFAVSELRDWRNRFDSRFAALYAPWVKVVDPRRRSGGRGDTTRAIPPSGHIAGVYAATDLRHGVHVAPANVALEWVQDVLLPIDDERHGLLNAMGIDVIRPVDGRGVRPLGARTVSSDTDWRFVNVRRLVSMIERAIDIAIQWAVFEPNDWRTRAKLALVIGSFLRSLWARGALTGNTIEEAFFVRCDDSNNPPDARDRGELLIEVGVAAVVPFEFVVLRIGRDANGFAITEQAPA